MVLRAIALFLLLADLAYAAIPPLQAGREALVRGDREQALAAYKEIGPEHPLWQEKLEDLIRFHLGRKEGEEAWRVIQIGRRTLRQQPSWSDYERLALFHEQSCPLAIAANDRARGYLLNAAVFRFNPNMFTNTPASPRSDGESHLAPGIVPYLKDIPKTELLPNQGCRAAKFITVNRERVPRAELNELLSYLSLDEAESSNRLLVLLRALDLSSSKEAKDEVVHKSLLAELPSAEQLPWREFPDPERQWLFVKSFNASRLEAISPEHRTRAKAVALQAIQAPDASANWLAVLDLQSMGARERREILGRAEKLGTYPARAWVLYELALAEYDLGNTNAALTVLRRLLVEREVASDSNIEDACVSLAAKIFADHKLDSRTQGALENALPARLWNSLLKEARMHAALAGRAQEFARLSQQKHLGPALELDLTKDLARRDLSAFRRSLKKVTRGSGHEGRLITFSRTLASYMAESARSGLAPYTGELSRALQSINIPGSRRADEINDIVQVFSSLNEARERAGQTVRKGVIKVGVARWRRPDLKPVSFVLQPPTQMPLRELYYVPDLSTERGWKFSTARR